MGLLNSLMDKMNISGDQEYDEDYDDYIEDENDGEDSLFINESPSRRSPFRNKKNVEYAEEQDEIPARSSRPQALKSKSEESGLPDKSTRSGRGGNLFDKVVPMRGAGTSAGRKSEVCMVIPQDNDDSSLVVNHLLNGSAVILNLEGMHADEAQRIIDFVSGACYSIQGKLQKISSRIFIVTPDSVDLSGDFDELLSDVGTLDKINLTK